MLSVASSGSASDSTKTSPSFSIASVVIGTLLPDHQPFPAIGNPPAAETTIGNGQNASDISHAALGPPGGFVFTDLNVAVGASGGRAGPGGQQLRPTDSPHTIQPVGATASISHTNFNPGDHTTLFDIHGQGFAPSFAGNPQETQINGLHPSMGPTSDLAPGTHRLMNHGFLTLQHDDIFNGVIPVSRAEFEVVQNSILVQDENTGMYIVGPTDNFTFNLRLVN